ncbi:MAG TPA: polyprenol phosphomannose-dependent alpha 1,6 mannosyltransferase MptB [Solirubrobacterales bacterium]|nr:polyprenol phosphomannose-dependent alpha 1,6 mannosyltransferase MptB [Solirubrobacterales bacterium]
MLVVAPRLGMWVVGGLIVVAVVAFACAPVLLSHDAFSYVDYARLGVKHGLDPYVNAPEAAPTDPAFAHVTWTETPSAYGPLFTIATYPLAWLPVWAAIAVLKAVAAISVLGLAWVVSRLAAWRGVDESQAAAFVALNPLVLVHVVGGAHNDGLAMFLAMLGVAALVIRREASSGAFLVASAAIKSSSLFVAPFAFVEAIRESRPPRPLTPAAATTAGALPPSPDQKHQWQLGFRSGDGGASPVVRLAGGALAAAVVFVVVGWVAFAWHWLHAFGLAGENQGRTSHLSIPVTFARLTGIDESAVRVAALVLFGVAVVWLLVKTWQGFDWIRAAAWAGFGLLLATSWLLPWYLVWPLPLVAVARDRRLAILLLALTAYQLGARIPL